MLASEIGPGSLLAGDALEYRLGPVLAEGGEGVVYFVDGRDDVLAKIYKEDEYGRDAKLRALIGLGTKRLRRVAAWPLSSLYSAEDRPVGFIMESLEDWQPLHSAYQIRSRLRDAPHRTWAFLVRIARNLATCVHHVHEHGLVIGDLSETNVLVGPDAMVKIIDADSFQLRLPGRLYACKVAKPELLAPELQEVALEGMERTPNQDLFSLAVLIFQTLLFGRHPFAGRSAGEADVSIERAIVEGWYAFTERRDVPLAPPPHLTLRGLSPEVCELFERAFDPAEPRRPTGREWFAALRGLESRLQPCPINGSHFYGGDPARDADPCPWCALEEKWNITLFRPAPGDPLSAAQFDVDALWKRIEALPWPIPEQIPGPIDPRRIPPAPLSRVQRRVLRPLKLAAMDFSFWTLFSAVLVGPFVARAGPLGQIALGALALGAAGACLYAWNLRRRVAAANQELEQIARLWDAGADPKLYEDRLLVLRCERNALLAGKERYRAAREAKICEVHRPDLDRFLRKYSIMGADGGPGSEGRTRLTSLLDRGVASAADVVPEARQRLRDIDGEFWTRLLEWRRELERQFWGATSYGLPPHEERSILERIYREDVGMRRDLVAAEIELRELATQIERLQKQLSTLAEPLEAKVRRYGGILAALEPSPKPPSLPQ